MRTSFRVLATILGFIFGTALLVPLVQANVQKWAEANGYDQYLIKYARPAMDKIVAVAHTEWFIFFAGFFIGGAVFLWADFLIRRRSLTASTSTTGIDSGYLAHGLYLEKMHVGIDKTQKTVQIGFVLRNATDEPIRYEVEQVTAVIAEKTVTNPNFVNTGGVIARGANTTFFFAPIKHSIGSKVAEARASIEYRYGRAAPDTIFVREANYTTNVTIGPKGNAYVILEENDGAI
jgi:hypothetical protein